ncbi:MAG: alpha/beta hydrolase [Actinobacteria bacterium]|nr:alpha/beta hydrolase [Actinomycetota bacterium]
MSGAPATTRDELLVFIPCGNEQLSAVLTVPTVQANGMAVLFYAGRWSVTSIGRSRLWVHLARELAGHGFHCLRMDYIGLGESTGEEREVRLDKPFTDEPASAELWLRQHGISEFIVVGTCAGARMALESTREMTGVRGAVLIAPPARDFQKGDRSATLPTSEFVKRALTKRVLIGLSDANTRRRYIHHVTAKARRLLRAAGDQKDAHSSPGFEWASRNFLEPLEGLIRRRLPVLIIYGQDDEYFADFQRARKGEPGRLIDAAADLLTLNVLEGRFHGLSETEVQRLTLGALEAWLPVVSGVREDAVAGG